MPSLPPPELEVHHDGSERYLSDPNPALGDTVTAFVRAPLAAGVKRVVARAVHDAEPFRVEASIDHANSHEQVWRVELEAHNPITSYRFHLTGDDGTTAWLNGEGVHRYDVTDDADFRLSTEHRPPRWVHRTTWYQVFPDRFARRPDGQLEAPLPDWAWGSEWDEPIATGRPRSMTQIFGGSLNGLTAHLDHLSSLGVTGLYTCPFFPAWSNHRYDAASFDRIDPLLGGDEALRRLVAEASRRGIRVMGDLTTNHSGHHHEWFTAAAADPRSPTRPFYSWRPDGTPEYWLGVPSLPKFDHSSEALRRKLYDGPDSIAGRYLGEKFGLSAMRIDVANMTGRLGAVDHNRRCATTLRQTMERVRPDGWLLAEHFHDATRDLDGGGWHGTMNYSGLTRPAWTWLRGEEDLSAFGDPGPVPRRSGPAVARSARTFLSRIPYSVALTNMNLLGSHDTARWLRAAGTTARASVGLAMLCTWPGSPSVFYGDEIGLAADATSDVTTRAPFPWHDRRSWNTELLETYRTLLTLRSTASALAVGGMRWLSVGEDHLVYLRESCHQRLLVHLARYDHSPLVIDGDPLGAVGWHVLAGADVEVPGQATATGVGPIELTTSGPTWRIVELLDR